MTEHQESGDDDAVERTPPEQDDDDPGAEPIVVPRPGAPSIPMDPPDDADG